MEEDAEVPGGDSKLTEGKGSGGGGGGGGGVRGGRLKGEEEEEEDAEVPGGDSEQTEGL